MNKTDATKIIDAVLNQTIPVLKAMRARIATLEKHAGIEPPAASEKEHVAGDVITMGGARWVCRGAGRYRRIED